MKTSSLITLFILVLFNTACGGRAYMPMYYGSQSHSASVSGSDKGFQEFKTGLYAFVNSQNCVKCHGAIVNPMFASPDVNTAYQNAMTRVDFNSPDTSKFIAFAGNSHCADTPCSNPANSAVVKGLVEAWAAAELSAQAPVDPTSPSPAPAPSPSPGTTANKSVTATVNIPANLPNLMTATPAVIRFQLSALNPQLASLSNAIFEVEIQLANPTTYRLNRPKIVGNTAPVNLDGIHVFVKVQGAAGMGSEDLNQGLLWSNIAVTAGIFPKPATLPVGPLGATPLQTKAIDIQMQSPADAITIVFDNLR